MKFATQISTLLNCIYVQMPLSWGHILHVEWIFHRCFFYFVLEVGPTGWNYNLQICQLKLLFLSWLMIWQMKTERKKERTKERMKDKKKERLVKNKYWLNYWHILISKGLSGFTSNTLLIMTQYFYQFKYFTDLIKAIRRMVKWNSNEISNTEWNRWSLR